MEMVEFWTICSSNGIVLDKKQLDSFERYAGEIKYWNEKVNLISRKDEGNILEKHILHSLTILKYLELPDKSHCLDIGTGGGFPGIPLKIAQPEIHMLLADSIAKKVKITDMMAKHTGLHKIEGITARVEDLTKDKKYHNRFDFIFARAVAQTNKLIGWTQPLLKKGGKFVFLKGGNLDEEIAEAKKGHKGLEVEEIKIDFLGLPDFAREEKKLLICTLK